MKNEDRIAELKKLRVEASATKQAMHDLEDCLSKTREEFNAKRAELKDLTEKLQDAVRADAKATVALLKAEARARLLGIALDALDKV